MHWLINLLLTATGWKSKLQMSNWGKEWGADPAEKWSLGPAHPPPPSSAVASLSSREMIVSDAYFPSCFTDAKDHHQMEEINYLMTMTRPTGC